MSDTLRDLILDTLSYLKDPLLPKQTIFANAQECALFQKKPQIARPETPKSLFKNEKVPQPPPPIFQPAKIYSQKSEAPPQEKKHAQEKLPPTESASSIKNILQKIAPALKLSEHVPGDEEAKKIANAWKEKIIDAEVILAIYENDVETLEFLKVLAKAIDQHLAKTKMISAIKIEEEKRWDFFLQKNNFRLIIASMGMQQCPEFMRLYQSVPASAQFFLDKTPLLPLSHASLYKSLEHKALLWKTLCQMLKK